jgi:hypothetical protein
MRGAKNGGYAGDAADIPMREPFKWNAVAGPPMSNYYVLNSDAYNNSVSGDNDGRSVEEQLGVNGSLLEAYRDLIGARRDNVALRRGDYTAVTNATASVWTFVRAHEDQQMLVAINLSGSTRTAVLDLAAFAIPGGATTPIDAITGEALTELDDQNKAAYSLPLAGYGYGLYALELIPPPPPVSVADGRDIPADSGPLASLALQDNATGLGDNVSELNQLCVRSAGDSLLIGLTGNLALDGTGMALLLDTDSGGQNVLDLSNMSPPPGGPDQLTGLRLDAGFEPDRLIFVNAYAGNIYVDDFTLLSGGGAEKTFRGQGSVNDGDGFLYGGENPHGMQVALDNTNLLGVTDSDPSGAATATTGFEMFLPFADLGLTAGVDSEVKLAAFLLEASGNVSNQWLPGLGGGWANLGTAPDLTIVPGNQHVTLPLLTAIADPGLPGSASDGAEPAPLDLRLQHHNPTGSRIVLTIRLPEPGPARLAIYDIRGRLVKSLWRGIGRAGEQTLTWDGATDEGARAPAGVYIGRLEFGGRTLTQRVVLIR